MKFKLNDPVRIIATPSRYFDTVGTITDVDRDHPRLPYQVGILENRPLWFGPEELILAEHPAPTPTAESVKWPLRLRDKVRILADPDRNGQHAGRTGTIVSNELDGIVFIHLGTHYANFRTNDLERIPETP